MNWPRESYFIPIYFFSRIWPRPILLLHNRLASYVLFRLWREKRQVWQKNLSVVLGKPAQDPSVKKAARQLLLKYGLYLCDYMQMYRLFKGKAGHLIPEVYGMAHLENALKWGKGAILITPHLGHWELGSVLLTMRDCPLYAITLRDPEKKVQDFRDQARASMGVRSIHIDPERFETVLQVVRLLKENSFVALLGDRWEGGKKAAVRFFDQEVYFPVGAAALALASGAPLIPAYTILQENGRYATHAEEPIWVRRQTGVVTSELLIQKTQELARVFEKAIARYPDQWYHFFDYWERFRVTENKVKPEPTIRSV
jgi:KDO2-lipid IV(A) lauroyltransferase